MKRVLVFSDLHCQVEAAEKVVEMSANCDLVIGAGDFANQHQGLEICLDILREVQRPFIAVPGNNETEEALRSACADWKFSTVLHGESIELAGLRLFGIGGGIPVTPFGDWSFDLDEQQARHLLADCLQPDILISHSPPAGHVDQTSTGESVGSEAIFEAVERHSPQWVVCGHIHDSWGQESIYSRTRIVNVGPSPQVLSVKKRR